MTERTPTHRPSAQGHRLSVGWTTARRCPFARTRPEASDLPTRLPVACVAFVARVRERAAQATRPARTRSQHAGGELR